MDDSDDEFDDEDDSDVSEIDTTCLQVKLDKTVNSHGISFR